MSSPIAKLKKSPISHILLTFTFLVSGIILNIMQGFLYIFLKPISKKLFKKMNYYLTYSIFSQWWSGTDFVIYSDDINFKQYFGKEHAYLIVNHTYEIDWLIGWEFTERVGVLGNGKAYCKKSLQYVPIMGWAWKVSDYVFVERNYEKDKYVIGRQVAEAVEYPDPIFLVMFAEGTRFTEEKHKASLAFSKEKGLPLLKRHLTPRSKGFTSSLPMLRGRVPAIYNMQLCFPNVTEKPTIVDLLLGRHFTCHMYIERIPLDDVPEDEEEAVLWLTELYKKKDRLMDSILTHGDYFATSGERRLDGRRLPRRPYTLLNMIGWAVITLVPLVTLLISFIMSGSTLNLFIVALIIFVCYFALNHFIKQTMISKSSSYGKTAASPEKIQKKPY